LSAFPLHFERRESDMPGKFIENAVEPVAPLIGGTTGHNVERPDCGHMVTIQAYMKNNAIPKSEQESIKAQLAQPCAQCAKEKKNAESK
jgi:hypothetical protein